jgi:hypothetical protein
VQDDLLEFSASSRTLSSISLGSGYSKKVHSIQQLHAWDINHGYEDPGEDPVGFGIFVILINQ